MKKDITCQIGRRRNFIGWKQTRSYMYMYVAMALVNGINKRVHMVKRAIVIESNTGQRANTQTHTLTVATTTHTTEEETRQSKRKRWFMHEFTFSKGLF